ncbi:MAG: alpha/beta hydrolase, partial [Anaerolineales bacterium]|nr:alpha/beta hydrolase [Anaerolineales bacterium]
PPQEKTDSFPNHIHQVNLEGTGHFPMIDNPTQFNRLLTDFLALDSGASPRELQLKEEWKRRVR